MVLTLGEYEIRDADLSDATEISRLLTLLGHATEAESVVRRWNDWSTGCNAALVANNWGESQLLGVLTLHRMRVLHRPMPVGRITSLIVDTHCRGLGIGKSLVATAEARMFADGCGLIEITSNFRLVDAHAFYEHLGYTQTSVRLAKVAAT